MVAAGEKGEKGERGSDGSDEKTKIMAKEGIEWSVRREYDVVFYAYGWKNFFLEVSQLGSSFDCALSHPFSLLQPTTQTEQKRRARRKGDG